MLRTRSHQNKTKRVHRSTRLSSRSSLPKRAVHSIKSRSFSSGQPDKPVVLNVLAHQSYDNIEQFDKAYTDQFSTAPPAISFKIFTTADNFQTLPIHFTADAKRTSIIKLCADIQSKLPIKPAFVSFSTDDSNFIRRYYSPSLVIEPYKKVLYAGNARQKVSDIVEKGADINQSGFPPADVDMSTLFMPSYPSLYFNAPEDVTKLRIDPEHNKLTIKSLLYKLSMPNKNEERLMVLNDRFPMYYNPDIKRVSFHPFSCLDDLSAANNVIMHISYHKDTIKQYPSLQELSQRMNATVHYPTISPDIVTFNYPITAKDQRIDLTGFKDRGESKVLGILLVLMAVSSIYNYYDEQELKRLVAEHPDIDSDLRNSHVRLQQEVDQLTEHMTNIAKKLHGSTLRERISALVNGKISLNDVLNPFVLSDKPVMVGSTDMRHSPGILESFDKLQKYKIEPGAESPSSNNTVPPSESSSS